jgi:hypothetical protein
VFTIAGIRVHDPGIGVHDPGFGVQDGSESVFRIGRNTQQSRIPWLGKKTLTLEFG